MENISSETGNPCGRDKKTPKDLQCHRLTFSLQFCLTVNLKWLFKSIAQISHISATTSNEYHGHNRQDTPIKYKTPHLADYIGNIEKVETHMILPASAEPASITVNISPQSDNI